MQPSDIISFWFEEVSVQQHFAKDAEFDTFCRRRFEAVYWRVLAGECAAWRFRSDGQPSADGRLAEILVLDQLARNMFRGSAQSFVGDPLALALAQELVGHELLAEIGLMQRKFALMPYMHSESLQVQESAVPLYKTWLDDESLRYLQLHRDILVRYGRFPHRNHVIGRTSTAEEQDFLQQPGSGF